MTGFVDPEELPFSTDELFRAGCCFLPVETARMMADHLTECGPIMIADRVTRRAVWRKAGMPGADTAPLHGWCYHEELLPALASLSPDAEARARRLAEDNWHSTRQLALSGAQHAAAERAGIIPTREEAIRQAKAAAVSAADRRALRAGLASGGPPLPPPTAEMEAAADAEVAALRSAWEAMVARFRKGA